MKLIEDLCSSSNQNRKLVLSGMRLFRLTDNANNEGSPGTVVIDADGKLLCAESGTSSCSNERIGAVTIDLKETFYGKKHFFAMFPFFVHVLLNQFSVSWTCCW